MKTVTIGLSLAALAVFVKYARDSSDILNGFNSLTKLSDWQIQVGVGAFCVSPLVSQVQNTVEHSATENTTYNYDFDKTGGINEEDYDKASIYAILYAMYDHLGQIKMPGQKDTTFEFTFNTWGITPKVSSPANPVKDTDPQRHGMNSYGYFVNSPELQKHLASVDGKVKIVEIGCGTGAGANHLSKNVFTNSQYMAIDMQAGAIDTCNRLHASDRLQCVHIPTGVGNDGGAVPQADKSVDIVIILETHIAEQRIGPEEKAIFAEITRILKPGGYFLWGNALPTDVWYQAEAYLPTINFQTINRWNNTKEAVIARDEDAPRVEAIMEAVRTHYMAFKIPYFGASCSEVIIKLIRNFYRDPSTAMYDKMVQGYDSYMHYVFQLPK